LVINNGFCDWSTQLAALRKNRTRFYFLAERCGTPQGACGTLRYGLFYVTSFVNGKILALRYVTLRYRLLEIGLNAERLAIFLRHVTFFFCSICSGSAEILTRNLGKKQLQRHVLISRRR